MCSSKIETPCLNKFLKHTLFFTKKMSYVTGVDNYNAALYAMNRLNLRYVLLWRKRFPHILIDYTIRWATNDDFYVPPSLRLVNAVVTDVMFSKEGCEAMSCYPFTETGVIDLKTTPIGGYTQTSYTPVQYNQPACFHLDTVLANRDENIQSTEMRYAHDRCVMVDTVTKMWLNTPYLRTEDHVVAGVDDVPGFDVRYDDDPVFPERVRGRFNDAYCRRFGRQENQNGNGCAMHWLEVFTTFILGESIYTSFKLMANNVFSDLRNFDYRHPSSLLPPRREPEGEAMLKRWREVRDSTHDPDAEERFVKGSFDMGADMMIVYTANRGFRRVNVTSVQVARDIMESMLQERMNILNGRARERRRAKVPLPTPRQFKLHRDENGEITADRELDEVVTDFLLDHSFILGLLADFGLTKLENYLGDLLKRLNMQLIPMMRRVLLAGTRRFTAQLLGHTYRAMALQALTRSLVNTVTAVARTLVAGVKMAMSVVSAVLGLLTIADFVLMIWDPFGYNNMFPRGYLDDMSNAFLASHFASLGVDNREILEIKPIHFMHFIVENVALEDSDTLMATDYLSALDVNSNGQIVDLNQGPAINDFDDEDLLGAALASYDSFAYFQWYCKRHDRLVVRSPLVTMTTGFGCFGLFFAAGGIVYFALNYESLTPQQRVITSVAFLLLILLCMGLILFPTFTYFAALANHNTTVPIEPEPENVDERIGG